MKAPLQATGRLMDSKRAFAEDRSILLAEMKDDCISAIEAAD